MASFEERMTALEDVVARLERGDLPLEESVQLFEEGMRLTTACRKDLDSAEGRLHVLAERPGGGMVGEEMRIADGEDAEDEE